VNQNTEVMANVKIQEIGNVPNAILKTLRNDMIEDISKHIIQVKQS
jgi:hypothetical protein